MKNVPAVDNRIDWDTLWMTMALTVAQRSVDPATKHGCIIVDKKNKLVSMGYNSFPRDCVDESMPLTRPAKYKVIIHSETNAIINAGDRDQEGCTVYVTGHPCTNCFGNMLNAGITKIVYGPVGSHCLSEEDIDLTRQMNISASMMKPKIRIMKFEDIADIKQIAEFIDEVKEYTNEKIDRTDLING